MARKRAKLEEKGSYFTSDKAGLEFIPSGCTLLDCALGGGWALGRMSNIVGDKSTAKTGLATEALINFHFKYPDGAAAYCETEAAFDKGYAQAMGLPIEHIDFRDDKGPIITVEEFSKDFNKFLDARVKDKQPGIYVLDSLDALSDAAEMDRDLGDATYGTAKAKLLSEFFRKTSRVIENTRVNLLIVSQVRDNIGARFGDKQKRAGGKSMDFYASQVAWLANIKTHKKTIKKAERAYGIRVLAKIKKNKVGLPFREAEFDFLFGYGTEDLAASVSWLHELGRLSEAGLDKDYLKEIADLNPDDYRRDQIEVTKVVKRVWAEIETSFLPKRSKYG